MSDLISMGSSGVLAYQRALSTVSNNIANIGTDGYSRQDVSLASSMPRSVGIDYIGTGVYTTGVKRAYDAFVESNLRNSSSDLQGQGPVVQYANRLVDVMASETTGLSGSLSAFFASARDLGAEPASVIARGAFLRQADGLATGFRQLSGQIQGMDDEVRSGLDVAANKINALADQLVLVNKQLFKQPTLDRQPPELLDQRDNLLRDLAKLVRVDTAYTPNGQVRVSINGNTEEASGAFLVNNDVAQRFSFRVDPSTNRLDGGLLLDTSRERLVSNVSGGEVGGLLAVREQVVQPARDRLNALAQALMDDVNAIHREGIDATGAPGQDLFGVSAGSKPAQGMTLLITNPQAVAAASPLRITANELNVSVTRASLNFNAQALTVPATLSSLLSAGPSMPSPERSMDVGVLTALTTLSAGTRDAAIYMDTNGQWPQLITRDGRHLLGSPLSTDQQSLLLKHPSIEAGASYDTSYLNSQRTEDAYLKSSYFIGAKAAPTLSPNYSLASNDPHVSTTPSSVAAELQGQFVLKTTSTPFTMAAGQMTLNGVELSAYSDDQNPATLAAWLNTQSADTGVSARVVEQDMPVQVPGSNPATYTDQTFVSLVLTATDPSQEIRLTFKDQGTPAMLEAMGFKTGLYWDGTVPEDLLVFAASPSAEVATDFIAEAGFTGPSGTITINGVDLPSPTGLDLSKPQALVDWINLYAGQTGASASLQQRGGASDREFSVVFSSTDIYEPITVTGLGLTAATAQPRVTEPNTVGLSAQFETTNFDRLETLRSQRLDVVFADNGRYAIQDRATGTVLAQRTYDPHVGQIEFRGLTIQLSGMPVKGDRFTVDGNRDGTGNNANIKALAELEFKRPPGGTTLTESYLNQTSQVGNVARQAKIAQEALTVVNAQAMEARESLAGVSLDEEAANLIRFQQAYQANAKVMQTANTLFDALINIR
jgi:flagellar hook-associated protein FlgK